jgi:hypothetical protein
VADRFRLEDPGPVRQDPAPALAEQLAHFERILREAGENLTVLGGVAAPASRRVADGQSSGAQDEPAGGSTRERELRTLAVLERWLHAIYVVRTQRSA